MNLSFVEELIRKHEAVRRKVYLDTEGIPTIAIGLNLLAAGAPQLLKQVGADYGRVLHGLVELTDEQIEQLFQHSFNSAIKQAKADVPNFDKLADNTQAVLVDMAFNLGEKGLAEFHRAIAHLQADPPNYLGAAAEFKSSKWFIQTKTRGTEDVRLVEQDGAVAQVA